MHSADIAWNDLEDRAFGRTVRTQKQLRIIDREPRLWTGYHAGPGL